MLCNLCPRQCNALRTDTVGEGYCRMPAAPVAARAALHMWEEPPISGSRGSGTIFFSGCSLGCVFCQNEKISHQDFGRPVTVEKLVFRRRESIDKAIKLIVLDEFSMVSDEVLADVARFGVKMLVCGDGAQLPPVEGMNSFISSPDVTLKTIVRQQEGNPIIRLARDAMEGKYIPFGTYGDRAFVLSARRLKGEYRKKYMLKADQIICGLNKTRAKVNDEVRGYLGYGGLREADAQRLLAAGVRLIGTNNLSIAAEEVSSAVHTRLLESEVLLLEGLWLEGLSEGAYELIALPLRLVGAEGAPARAFVRAME